jgi:hypothetical protein
MKFIRRTAGYTLFGIHKRNEEILEELKVEPVDQKPKRYKSNLLQHVAIINSNRMPKVLLDCTTNGRRRRGRPLKRLLDEGETCLLRPNW